VAAHLVHHEPEAEARGRVSQPDAATQTGVPEGARGETRVDLPEQLVAETEVARGAVSRVSACSSAAAAMVAGLSTRTPSSSPPRASAAYTRASPSAVVNEVADPSPAARHARE